MTETTDQMKARWAREQVADQAAVSLGLARQTKQHGIMYWTGNGEQFRAGYWAGREEPGAAAVPEGEQLKALKAKTACCMGVGNGDGNLFVYGDYDSIKAAQALVLRAEAQAAVQAVPEQWTDLARRCLIAMEMAVEWGKTREGRPPAQTCLFEIDDLRAMLAAPRAQPADALDANPLTSDGDCARLEAEMAIDVCWSSSEVSAYARHHSTNQGAHETFRLHGGDKQKARRYAVNRLLSKIQMNKKA